MAVFSFDRRIVDASEYPWGYPILLWTPAEIATALWLDAADSGTITESGGEVSTWNDKSGNDRHATNTGTGKPTTSTLDGKTALAFSSQFLNVSCPLATNMMVFEVFGRASAGILSQSIGGSTNGAPPYAFQWWTDNVRYSGLANSNASPGYSAHGTANTATGAFISGVDRDASHVRMRFFGGLVSQEAALTLTSASFAYIGRRGASYHNGLIAEVIVILDTVSTDDREKLEGYLAHKWGLTANLLSDHPYKAGAPGV